MWLEQCRHFVSTVRFGTLCWRSYARPEQGGAVGLGFSAAAADRNVNTAAEHGGEDRCHLHQCAWLTELWDLGVQGQVDAERTVCLHLELSSCLASVFVVNWRVIFVSCWITKQPFWATYNSVSLWLLRVNCYLAMLPQIFVSLCQCLCQFHYLHYCHVASEKIRTYLRIPKMHI